METLIFILSMLIIIVILQNSFTIREGFNAYMRNEPILKSVMEYQYRPILKIYKEQETHDSQLDKLHNLHNNIEIYTIPLPKDTTQCALYTDVFTYNAYYKHFPLLTICNIPKHLILFSTKENTIIQDINTKIGYVNDIDKSLFEKIVKSQKQYSSMNFTFVKLPHETVMDSLFKTHIIDVFVFYNTMQHPFISLMKDFDYKLISYDSMDNDLFKYYLPFGKREIIQLSTNSIEDNIQTKTKSGLDMKGIPKKDNNILIYNSIVIDTCICVFKNETHTLRDRYIYLLNYFNSFLKINFYIQFFHFLNISKQWSLKKQNEPSFQNTLKNGDDIRIIEEFNNTINHDINEHDLTPIKHDNYVTSFTYPYNIDNNGIPIKVGDRLVTHTGIGNFSKILPYYVININPITVTDYKTISITTSNIIKKDSHYLIPIKELNMDVYEHDRFFIMNTHEYGDVLTEKKQETYTYNPDYKETSDNTQYLRVYYVEKKNNFETGYRCYQDNTIISETECIDSWNPDNTKRDAYTWDKPCIKHTECPFYLKNGINKGGCDNGYCEFPLGIKRMSWRQYDKNIRDNNYFRCEECDDSDIMCCTKHPKPHYIF